MGKGTKKGGKGQPGNKKGGKSKKSADRLQKRIIEDKTFGLKNKNKSKKVQRYVSEVKAQARQKAYGKGKPTNKTPPRNAEQDAMLNLLFKQVITQPKVPPGVDPKSVLCEYFKHGKCKRGKDCKYSHDMAVGRKGVKRDLYSDGRDGEEEEASGMDDWDQAELEAAVKKKHGARLPKSHKICKFFLEAIETRKYGWFWTCPNNGEKCQYKHALPEGYVFESERKRAAELAAANAVPLCDELEEERQKVTDGTPLTHELFLEWKARKAERLAKEKAAAEKQRKADIKAGRAQMSGREILEAKPELATGDDDGVDFDISMFRKQAPAESSSSPSSSSSPVSSAGPESAAEPSADKQEPEVEIDEDLFAGEDLDDLGDA